ncbi:MAG TPA: VTT domain-containing protein [Labilithrix sp.]|nr:VTT domain-containing protein [Labilithrix sp.]
MDDLLLPPSGVDRETKYETAIAVLRVVVSFAVLVVAVSFLGWAFRDELSGFGAWFVDRFGVAGMVGGAFLADSLHFPIPPQFYLLTGIAGGYRVAIVVLAVLVGSELGGFTAFVLARGVGRSPMVARRLETARELLTKLIARRGYLGLAAATLLPVSFSILCMASGAMRLPYRAYGVLAVMRVPRILLSYAVIMLAWPR